MKKLITAALVAALAFSGNVYAHGAKPRHGGIVQSANDLTFELVANTESPTIYVEDHGKAVDTTGATGKLTVLKGTEKSETNLQPAAGGVLEAKGAGKLAPGSKAVATIALPGKKATTVRFAFK